MDLRMPGVDGLTAIERIARMAEPTRARRADDVRRRQPRAAALQRARPDFLSSRHRRRTWSALCGSPRTGTRCCPRRRPRAAGRRVRRGPPAHDSRAGSHRRPHRREIDVLRCLGEGMTNAAIATRLHLSEATVKSYVSRMLVKLDCTTAPRPASPSRRKLSSGARFATLVVAGDHFVRRWCGGVR